ncbi:MAG: FAD-binding oxidoreductase [Thermoplasmata archaeon]|nr:FAD-binding oxidoreductase [Thermoplasmata archaeon]
MPSGRWPSLERAVRGDVVLGGDALDRLGRDGSHVRGAPRAAVRPLDEDDVVDLVRWARRHRVALVPRGAGTSLDGESVPIRGGVVVDLSGWKEVGPIDAEARTVRVGPGVVNLDLQSALRPSGLFFPPNPGSWATCTIGGNVGTNASGPRSYGYGAARRWVRAVEAVLGTGERVRWGSLAEKRSVGPELLHVFVGSEGTLGIATAITLRLAPIPAIRNGWAVRLPAKVRLGRIASTLARTGGTGLSAIEYLDPVCAEGLPFGRTSRGRSGSALLLLEIEASSRAEARQHRLRVRTVLRAAGVPSEPTEFDDANRMWSVRGEAGRVLDDRYGPRVREDVAVPPARVDELVTQLRRIATDERVRLFLFGHLGEGSLHPNYEVDPGSPQAERIRSAVWRASLGLGGTISGEHGIGRLKRRFLDRELGAPAMRLLWAIRDACDPDGILNPGKLYADRGPTSGRSFPSPSGRAARPIRRGLPTSVVRRRGVRSKSPKRRAVSP